VFLFYCQRRQTNIHTLPSSLPPHSITLLISIQLPPQPDPFYPSPSPLPLFGLRSSLRHPLPPSLPLFPTSSPPDAIGRSLFIFTPPSITKFRDLLRRLKHFSKHIHVLLSLSERLLTLCTRDLGLGSAGRANDVDFLVY
jgi:hypothetical protein